MIQVNLLPGGKKRPARGKRMSIPLPRLEGLPKDRWILGAAVAGIVGVVVGAWLFLSVGGRQDEADLALEQALADSTRYSAQIERTNMLVATRDSIVQRVAIIQEIDQGRYVWPHVLDEVARALPDYTWLLQMQQITGGGAPRLRLVGRSGSIEAITVFMEQLEASPFLRGVSTLGQTQVREQNQLVYRYELEVTYEQPSVEFLETVPILPTGGAPEATNGEPPLGDTLDPAPPGR